MSLENLWSNIHSSLQLTGNGLLSSNSLPVNQASLSSPAPSPQLHHPPPCSSYFSPSNSSPSTHHNGLQSVNPTLMNSSPDLRHLSPATSLSNIAPVHPFSNPSGSYTNLSTLSSPPNSLPPHQPSLPLPPPSGQFLRPERSQSLGNIHLFASPHIGKRRASHGVPLLHPKRTRFHIPPTTKEEEEENDTKMNFPPNRMLSRCASQPVLFQPNHLPKRNTLSHQDPEEDDLDLIHSIISRDQSLDESSPDLTRNMRSQSFSHIPLELQRSMPSLHQPGSMHVLHENYASNPNLSTLASPPAYHQDRLPMHRLSGDMNIVPQYDHPLDIVTDSSSSQTTLDGSLTHPNNYFGVDLASNNCRKAGFDFAQQQQQTEDLLSPLGGMGHPADYPGKPLHVAGSPKMLATPSHLSDFHQELNTNSEVG